MKALEIIILMLALLGAGVVALMLWLFICNILDKIKRLIRNLRRKCPRCYERVGELDLYCKHCGKSLFKEVEE